MKKILLLLILLFGLLGCGEKYEPSILLGSHYKAVISKLGKPYHESDDGLIYKGPLGKIAYDYETFFSRNLGYFYNESGNDDNDRIDLIRVNIKGILPDENDGVKLANDVFLNGTAQFKLVKNIPDENYPNFKNVIYTSKNIGNLEDVGDIILTLFMENELVKSLELTSCNNEKLYKVLIKND